MVALFNMKSVLYNVSALWDMSTALCNMDAL